ncbi:MAG TPA: phosphate ABC transporter substrate-binding protein [Devosia sp.]|nr:phosphate ABC transporter substrate-binding protein [Devosia sp.]
MTTPSYPAEGPLTLRANITQYPTTKALMQGQIASDLVTLELAGLKNAHSGFKDMLRRNAYDVSEMAVATLLQAHEFGKPFSLLPVVVLGRFQHHCIGYNTSVYPTLKPQDLTRKRIAVRSYTQTTGLWVRGILQNEYGLDPDSVTWVCFDKPHVAEYTDPANIEWAPEGKDPVNMLLDGEVDAAVLGMNMPDDPRIKTLVPEPHKAAEAWHARSGVVPPNHYVIVPNSLCDERPDVVREVYRMLVESRNASEAVRNASIDAAPVGIEANRKALELAIQYALQQHMITKPIAVDDLFHPVVRSFAP